MDEYLRDESGRFAPGTRGGPGRPSAPRERDYLAAAVSRLSPEDFGEIVEVAVRDAKAGDPVARSWVAKIVLGAQPPRLSCLDADPMMEALLTDLYSRLHSPGAS